MAYLFPTPEPKETKAPPETTPAYLERVRSGSCYGAFRVLVGAAYWLGVLAVIITALGTIFLVLPFGQRLDALGTVGTPLVVTLLAGLALVLLTALRQSALLLVDIADTLLDAHRKKPTEKEH